MRYNFRGTGVAMITPFDAQGEIDFNALEKLVHFLTEGGIEYLVVLGTTGETATLDHNEKQKIFSFVAGANNGKLPLVAGIGGNDTRSVISDFKSYDLDGYSAILSVSPYYNKPSQEGLFQHYRAISEASPLPMMLYNVPGRTGMNVSAETTLRIAEECRNIFATKEASGNFDQIMQIIKYKPAGFEVISGDDGITLPMMSCGAIGVISVVANAYPRIFSDMVRLCLAGDYTTAQKLHYQLTDIIPTLFSEGSPAGVKAYMQELGLCEAHVRLPVVPVSSGLLKKIRSLAEIVKKQYVF
ncbi:4-hydroxy-tetrahydrodipicolinate synthase [Pollutibacter soli]|uniref:4-hydroxy-tetrahydrodipicolinate synthase n=1 Tax=Pollutibacter soli TaxID=3034157 RepID=UPI0030140CFB